MARFDVHRVRGVYYLDVQTDILPTMNTRLVVPLVPVAGGPRPIRRLHPIIIVDGVELMVATHRMVSVPHRSLGPPIASARQHYDQVVAAIDMVFNGF